MEETKGIPTVSRYNGGWLKTVNGLDKSFTNGFSIEGQFVKAGNYKMDYSHGLYLDCSKDGSRKNQVWNYHLFRVDDDGFHLLHTVENGGRNWACEFWEIIDDEKSETVQSPRRVTSQSIVNMIYERTKDVVVLGEVADKLDEFLGRSDRYVISGTQNRVSTKKGFECLLDFYGLKRIVSEDLDEYESEAKERVIDEYGFELSEKEFDEYASTCKIYGFLGVGLDFDELDLSRVWLDNINEFSVNGYFYEYEDCKYLLLSWNLPIEKLVFARVCLSKMPKTLF